MEKIEKNYESLPLKDMNLYPSIYTDVSEIARATRQVLKNGPSLLQNGKIITRTDSFYIPEEYFPKGAASIKNNDIENGSSEIFSLLKKELSLEAFEEKNVKETLSFLTNSLNFAKSYFTEYLGLGLPSDLKKIKEFNTLNDIISFLKRTHGLKEREGIASSPYYCALVQIMRAEVEYKRGDFEGLEKNAEWIENEIFNKQEEFIHFVKTGNVDEAWDEIVIISGNMEEAPSKARFSVRGKTHERAITKMLGKVNFNSREAINDGIGLRLEVPDNVNEQELISFLAHYFSKKFSATHLECKDNNFLNTENLQNIKRFEALLDKQDVVLKPQDNEASNEKYKAIDLKGYMRVSAEEKKQPFEVQIVRLGNNNEDGMARHEIYEPLQKMIVVTRLLGSFSEKYLDLLVARAAHETRFSPEKIKQYYLERELVEVHSTGRNRKIKSFAAQNTINRIKSGGLIPNRISFRKNSF